MLAHLAGRSTAGAVTTHKYIITARRKGKDMNKKIAKDVEISKYQKLAFIKGTELGDLYEAMRKRWYREGEEFAGAFSANLFFNIGYIYGIRAERARRKK